MKNSAQFLQVFVHMSILANLSNRQQENSFIADNKVLNHETEPWLFEITCFNSLKRLQIAWHWPFKLNWAMKTSKRVVVVKVSSFSCCNRLLVRLVTVNHDQFHRKKNGIGFWGWKMGINHSCCQSTYQLTTGPHNPESCSLKYGFTPPLPTPCPLPTLTLFSGLRQPRPLILYKYCPSREDKKNVVVF